MSAPLNLFDPLAPGGTGIWAIGALSVLASAGLVDEVLPLWKAGDFAATAGGLGDPVWPWRCRHWPCTMSSSTGRR